MRRIGHRGAKGHAAENTIASFEMALALGCDEIETDVWLLDDGSLVISHDRPASRDGLLSLDEVLDLCRSRMAVNVEIKSTGSEERARVTGARVSRLLASRPDVDAYVSSFWWSALEAARATAPGIRRAFLYAASPDLARLLDMARSLELWALHPERAFVTPDLVAAAHTASLRVNAWTVNDPREISQLGQWGVDGIISDFPERVPTS